MTGGVTGRAAGQRDGPGAVRGWPTWRVVAAVAVGYAFGAWLAFVAFGATAIVVLFLPAGVTLGALVRTPRRQWPWILATVVVVEIAVDVWQGQSLRFVWGFAVANAAEPLVGALLLRHFVPGDVDLLRRRDLFAFLGCCVVAGPLVGGVCGATTISLGLGRSWLEAFLPFWAGDATGVLTVGGCVLAWRHRPPASIAASTRWALALALTMGVTAIGFWPAHLPLFYLPIPVLLGLAFSQRLAVPLTCGLAMTVTANVLTSAGHGPWSAFEGPIALKTATLQLFLAVAILGAWFLAVGVAERDAARSATRTERAARQRLHALQLLTTRLATAATSQAIAEAVVRDSVALFADRATLGVVSPERDEVVIWTVVGRPPELVDAGRQVALDEVRPLTYAARTGQRVVHQSVNELAVDYPQMAQAYRTSGVSSGLCLPVADADGPPLGALAIAFAADDAVDADTIAVAETVARLAGQALQRAQRHERELDAAHQLQRALLPVLAGGRSGIRVTADYRPADRTHDVGGDWYDVFPLPGDRIGLAVGDVVGHDLTAAAAMARVQSALRILAQTNDGPAQVLQELDRVSALITNSFMTTVGYADYDPATRVLRYACAGHLPPLLITADGVMYLWSGRSMPIGVHGRPRQQAEQRIPAGAALIWYTDGLVERHDTPLQDNLDRLATVAAELVGHDPDDLCQAILQHMAGGDVLRDDTIVLCIHFAPEPRAAVATPSQLAAGDRHSSPPAPL
ncbi:serine phosphatase RsbU (regulator of sigma subunit) [Krasilnikovia cinnamomea]|uniref:Serine phosphatase RsbU (Regulator of sigma subunit) n=1 Tax=Krasilnikovia cinnamomea TaxID=349313 RepID=A0A4Q7ZR45_9ACTN|nr:SpoIIE family protein phosphatase [Krasilnikovia cinnamomea]RZU53612.1 serine phosphatase RsbU (regulator of sigma subunit) [Krasilnikovia cinnamomea]